MNQNIWSLIGFAAVALIVVGGLAFLSQHYTLDNIKSKTVGDGQYGTARWATKREIQKTYRHVPFQPELWRKGEHLPRQQGLVLGSLGRKNHVTALVDCDDIHCLMIGASGVGKTAFFLYPNLEYACASGMSYLALDTKGDLARNYGAVASKYYGYQVSVIDLRNPTRSDGNNLLTLINRYMDLARGHPDNLTYKARAEKYTKILAKSIINPEGESSRGENAYFYESAESLLAAVILLLSEYLPPTEGEQGPAERLPDPHGPAAGEPQSLYAGRRRADRLRSSYGLRHVHGAFQAEFLSGYRAGAGALLRQRH